MAELKLEVKLKILLIVLIGFKESSSKVYLCLIVIYSVLPSHKRTISILQQGDDRWDLWYRLSLEEGHDKIQSMSNFNGKLFLFVFFSVTSETEHFFQIQMKTTGHSRISGSCDCHQESQMSSHSSTVAVYFETSFMFIMILKLGYWNLFLDINI